MAISVRSASIGLRLTKRKKAIIIATARSFFNSGRYGMQIMQHDQRGFPITITEIVTGKREIACRLRWENKASGEQNHSFWEPLTNEEKLEETVKALNEQYTDIDHHWIEYGYV